MIYFILGYDRDNTDGLEGRKAKVTIRQHYAYLSHRRDLDPMNIEFDSLLQASQLTSQWFCDMFAKIENDRLNYIMTHQDDLRRDSYTGLMDSISKNSNQGTLTILPSSHTNSPRYMYQCYLDAMAIVQRKGIPDLLVTFTANSGITTIFSSKSFFLILCFIFI